MKLLARALASGSKGVLMAIRALSEPLWASPLWSLDDDVIGYSAESTMGLIAAH
jgi:hypothetical protein